MLARDDRELAARDSALTGLGAALDPHALAALLGEATGLDVRPGRASYVRYKPGTNCLVKHTVRVGSEEFGVYAKVHGVEAVAKLDKASVRHALPNALGWTRWVFDQLGMVVVAFPNDDKLRRLGKLCGRADDRLLTAFGKPGGLQIDQVLAYKPERRFTARAFNPEGVPSVLKLFSPDTFRARVPAWSAQTALQLPRVVAQHSLQCARLFSWVEGVPLAEALDNPRMEQVAEGLRSLHESAADGLEPYEIDAEANQLREVAAFVGALCPPLERRLQAVLQDVLARLKETDVVRTPIHGDLHLGQIIIGEGRMGLIDLDRAGAGDPHRDLGQVIASLIVGGDEGEQLAATMLDAYRPPSGSSVRLFTDAALLRLLPAPFRNRENAWAERIETCLERIEARIARSNRCAFQQLIDNALDRPAFDRIRRLPQFGGTVRDISAHLIRSKPLRRFLVRYEIDHGCGTVAVLGKGRAKGVDRRSMAVSRGLARAAARSGGTFAIPLPLGVVRESKLWLQECAPGSPLSSHLDRDGARLGRRIAEALHGFHGAGVPTDRRHSRADELGILDQRLGADNTTLAALCPHVEELRLLCHTASRTVAVGPMVGIHRDLHPDQLLIDSDRVTFVDLDLYALGEPALDVGNLTAHVIELGLRVHGDSEAFAEFNDSFIDHYVWLAGEGLREAIRLYELLSLARLIEISVRLPGRSHTTEPLALACRAGFDALLDAHPQETP